jgi:pSer/pThr/pTyr-binding forkhead associated (FHA) protein
LDNFERFCPVCKRKNERKAITCRHCGALLEDNRNEEGMTNKSTESQMLDTGKTAELTFNIAAVPLGAIAIYIEDAADPSFVSSDAEFVVGRKKEETSETYLDLSRFGGYHLGISRRHALIRRVERGYELIDLSSTNGTWLNGEQLVPNKPYPLDSGSQLRLARMNFFILYRSVPDTKKNI